MALLTVLVHVDLETLVEAASLALVASRGVDDASSVRLADVLHVATDRALEEAAAAVAARHAVVLTRRAITAHQTATFKYTPLFQLQYNTKFVKRHVAVASEALTCHSLLTR